MTTWDALLLLHLLLLLLYVMHLDRTAPAWSTCASRVLPLLRGAGLEGCCAGVAPGWGASCSSLAHWQAAGAGIPSPDLVPTEASAPHQRYEHPSTHWLCCLIYVPVNITVDFEGWGLGALYIGITCK
jgi:hypothetical protein